MINWFKLDYLFTNYMAPVTGDVLKIAVGIYLTLFILAIVASFLRKRKQTNSVYKKFYQKISSFLFTFSIVGLILLFFRYQLIPFLGMRGWTLIWWAVSIVWLVFVLKYLFVDLPKKRQEQLLKEEFEKYLP